MDKAVCKLQLIVSRFNKSRLSSELRNALEAASPQAQLQETIAACVGLRSPHTVLKRANAILAFLRWADKEDTVEPLSEGSVWAFFSWLKREGAPPSRAASLMSAFRFINFVLGVSLQDLLHSRRLCGLSIQLGVQKTSASRARPLTVDEIKYLHKVLEDSKNPIGTGQSLDIYFYHYTLERGIVIFFKLRMLFPTSMPRAEVTWRCG